MTDTQQQQGLLPCPFCGSEDIRQGDGANGHRPTFHTYCESCSAGTQGHPTREAADTAWNRRALTAQRVGQPVAYMHRWPGCAWELDFADDDGKLRSSHSKAIPLIAADGECAHMPGDSCHNRAAPAQTFHRNLANIHTRPEDGEIAKEYFALGFIAGKRSITDAPAQADSAPIGIEDVMRLHRNTAYLRGEAAPIAPAPVEQIIEDESDGAWAAFEKSPNAEMSNRDDLWQIWHEAWVAARSAAPTPIAPTADAMPVAWFRKTDITELTDSEPETNGWTPLYATGKVTADAGALSLKRIAHELRTYNPAADEYKGEHIHKVWAREIDSVLTSALTNHERIELYELREALERASAMEQTASAEAAPVGIEDVMKLRRNTAHLREEAVPEVGKLQWLQHREAWAVQLLNRAVDLMTPEQVGQWKGVRAFLESSDHDRSNPASDSVDVRAAADDERKAFDAAHKACACRTAAGGWIFETIEQLLGFARVVASVSVH